jgi:hypothetical protein
LYGVAAGYLVLAPRAEDYAHRMSFDSNAWRARSMHGDPAWPTRLRIVDDLMASRALQRIQRNQVESLLGPGDQTDKWRDWDLVYWLGPERGLFRIDSEWLVIRFDPGSRVPDVQLVRD